MKNEFKAKFKLYKKIYLKASSKLLQLDSTMSGVILVSFVPVFLPVIFSRLAGTRPDFRPSTVARSQPLKCNFWEN
jgi:hypothetical protein